MQQRRSAKEWRDRAEEARVLAAELTHPVAKRTMRQIAEGYAAMAHRTEQAEILGGEVLEFPISRDQAVNAGG